MTTITTPAPAGAPPELTPGGRRAFRGVLLAAAAIIVTGSLAALAVAAWGVSTVRVATDNQTLPTTMRSLSIDAGGVPVAIRITGDRNAREARADLRVVNTSSGGDHRLTVTNEGAETRISVEGRPSGIFDWARGGEITVSLPPEQARRMTVRTQQDTGVTLVQTDLDQLIARTIDGSVVLRGAARRVEVQTVNGDIEAHRPITVAERFSATTSNGDIAVDFADAAPPTIEATSSTGDVVIGLPPKGPYLVRAQSDLSTKVQVPETSDPAVAVAEVTARSEAGDVVVEESERPRR
ncbi:DUF4097 family beta strand repeat protein [Mycolicibacterium sp. S2-37]|uniref:DUF4097 family beta strand repeat-containing protein n=1 Tax=Mycolicibacterium sp. S2-37 TaxID=2810297 RepID=UPI001A9440BB|nr:DUF4097 family beta strand repeat-containing protein [Mycolicibacterium sp. S2-37]MBO0679715.1 DUF4097 family beta strand repeat protein [Mycolicibacterium sp. S2-37]